MTKKTKTQYPHLLHAINTIHKISEENACEGSKNVNPKGYMFVVFFTLPSSVMNQSPWVQNIFKALSQSAGKNRDSALKEITCCCQLKITLT